MTIVERVGCRFYEKYVFLAWMKFKRRWNVTFSLSGSNELKEFISTKIDTAEFTWMEHDA